MLGMLKDQFGIDAVKVDSWDDRVSYEGYCETCSYETTVVDIDYVDSAGTLKMYTYNGNFSDLMNRLS